jgi:hypothetical protein
MSTSRLSSLLVVLFSSAAALSACGSEGPMGDMGSPGTMGDKGDKGDMGDPGTMGTPGQAGSNGAPGQNGSAGLSCWDQNGNGTCDLAMEDIDEDGACDVADCAGPQGPPGTGTAGQIAGSVFGTASINFAANGAETVVPGLSQTLTVPAATNILISTNGGILTQAAAANGFSSVEVAIYIDDQPLENGGYQRIVSTNTGAVLVPANWALSVAGALSAGSHTISVRVIGTSTGSATTVSGDNTSVLQGTLVISLIKT